MTIVAILKHLSSKSANYGKALEYLIFQHDERNGRPLRDENGNRMLREEYYLDGMNCDPFSFDKECEMLNADFHKNQTRGEVKSHHYIISFDPKDVTECGLTGEKAQALGREFAERFFAGHQALICTHTDGHNSSGNIHVHIVINSLRKFDVERQDFMERSNDSRAGFKHHQTRELLTAMQKGLMEITEREGLHQIDLLSPAPVKITEREYRKTQREQRKPGGKNFQTKLQEIRDAVYAASSHAKSLEEFKDALLTDYGIALRISRGRFSYLHPEREKYISARKLGTDFDQAHLLAVFAENSKTKTQKPQAHMQPVYDPSFDYLSNPEAALVFRSHLHLVVDLQSNLKAQQSAAYARKVTLSNLREAAKTLCFIQEHGYDSREELEAAFEASNHELTASRTALRESDDRIKELNEQIHYIGQYHSNKAVHSAFLEAKDKKSFREKHSAELDLYNAARTFLKKSFPDKVPTISKLKAERDVLIQEKKEKTNRYHSAKAAQKDLFTARTNVARILDEPIVFEKSKEATL